MPELNLYSDYRTCASTYNTQFKYCVAHVYIKPNQSSELWKEIEDFSSYTYQHYRHDVLMRGVCMNDCKNIIRGLEESQKIELKSVGFEIKQPYPNKIGQEIPELNWTQDDLDMINICNNVDLHRFYNLSSMSRISFCLTKQGDTARRKGDTVDHLFMVIVSALFGLVMLATISEFINHDQPSDSLFLKFLSCFDAKRNLSIINKPSSSFTFDTIKLALLVIIGCSHAFSALNMFAMVESFRLEDSVHHNYAIRIRGWQIYLPLLFLISGYFMSFNWIGKLLREERVPTSRAAWAIVKRLVRFFPSMAFMVFFFATRFYNWFSEPKWLEVVANERINCRKNGWRNLLFIDNVWNSRDGVSRIRLFFICHL